MNRTLFALLGILVAAPAVVQAQFNFTTNNSTITITGYTGPGGAVTIPNTTNGYPVTSIGPEAFYGSSLTSVTIGTNVTSIGQEAFIWCQSLTSITIPSSVTNIGAAPFMDCTNLTAITVAAQNQFYSSTNGVLFDKGQTTVIECPPGLVGSYGIPSGVTIIGTEAFFSCAGLTNVTIGSITSIGFGAFEYCSAITSFTIPANVASIGELAFSECSGLTAMYFKGNAPSADLTLFSYDYNLIAVYYLSGSTGWGATFAGINAVGEAASYLVTVSSSPSAGGTVSGGGTFASFNVQTVSATAKSGYTFTNWMENGIVVSPAEIYNFTLIGNQNLVANFTANPVTYSVTVSASPAAGGTASGGGIFASGSLQTVSATATSGYTFANWTENGSVVSLSASYTFTLGSNRNLVANFIASPIVVYVPSSFGSISTVTSAGVVGTLVMYFGSPAALAVDQNGNLYAAAGNVYKFTPSGAMSTFASGFNEPTGLAFDVSGNLYVADFGNGTISKITPAGVVSAFASGFPSDPHLGGNGTLSLACDGNGNVYLTDYGSGIVWKITPAGVVSTFASGFSTTLSMAIDGGGNVYLANFYGTVAKITPAGLVSTFASLSGYVTGLAFDEGGNLYASSTIAGAISRITTAGVVSTFESGFSGPIAIASSPTPPTITTQPQNQGFINEQGVFAKFSVGASGQNIAYQWQVSTNGGATWAQLSNNTNYNGVTSPTLSVTGVTPMISGYEYECVVTNTLGSTTSEPATLAKSSFLMYLANQDNGNVSEVTPTGAVNLFPSGFNDPEGLAFDQSGNLYVANYGNGAVSQVTPAGVVSTFAGGFSSPEGLAFDGGGNLYVANYGNGMVSEVTPAGVVSTFASGFSQPTGLAFDGGGNLYVANYGNGAVSQVTPAGVVSTFAGGFSDPEGLAFDGGGNLYVANYGNGTVSEVTPAGVVSTFASGFSNPRGLAFDGSGNLYVPEGLAVYGGGSFYVWNYGNGPVSMVTPTGVVSTYTGIISGLAVIAIVTAPAPPTITIQPQSLTVPLGENAVFSIDVSGAPGANTFQWQISTDGGMTWTPLSNNSSYSGVTSPTLTVSGISGISNYQFECVVANAFGSATSNPATLTRLPFLMYVANYGDNTISEVTPAGVMGTFAGGFSEPTALAVDGNGNLYVANSGNDTISKVTPTAAVSTFASGFTNATALAVDGYGNLYVAVSGNGTISKVTPAGLVSTFASGFGDPTALAVDGYGNLYVADHSSNTVSKITTAGVVSVFASKIFNPEGMVSDAIENLYVTDVTGTVYKITSSAVVSTFASGFNDPTGVALDGSGNVYVINSGNNTVSTVTSAGGVSTFVSGLNDPTAIAIVTTAAPLTTSNYTITVSASPSAGGSLSGGGTFASGSSSWRTVFATVNSGYMFVNWTESGNVVSWSPAYYLSLSGNVNLVANFIPISYQTLDEPFAGFASGDGTYAAGISGSNIVGYYTAPNGYTRGFFYNGNAYTILEDPNASGYTTPSGISSGSIVGSYANGSWHGFLYTDANYSTFSYFDGLYGNAHANGIDGQNVVGSFPDDNGTHGFLYNGVAYITLDDPNSIPIYNNGYLQTGSYTVANGISGNTIVGAYAIPSFVGLGVEHGFVYAGGNYTTMDVPGATGGTSINGIDGSTIVGSFTDNNGTHGFVYNGSTYTTLDDPNGIGSTYCLGISGDTLVGYYSDSNNVAHGFIATVAVNAYNTIIVSASPNGGGTVSGGGTYGSGNARTVTASAKSGYMFANWTENGTVVSSATNYTFTLNSNVSLVANFTLSAGYYTIAVTASPVAGGTVSGGGAFASGSSQTVTAIVNSGYTFTNWTQNGSIVSLSPNYTFILISNANLIAHFIVNPVTYTVTVSASPSVGGSVSGGGTFVSGSSQTVIATPNSGYLFVNWTENGGFVSASATYGFKVYDNRDLIANFITNTVGPPSVVWIQPTNVSVAVALGSNVTFSVSVTGTGPLSYQWQQNGTNLPNGIITTVAGNGVQGYSGDGGAATSAELYYPEGVILDATGNLLIADSYNNRVRKVGTNGIISTVAGNGTAGYNGDGGAATNAELNYPLDAVVDGTGNLIIVDYGNSRIRKVGTNGIITTFAGNGTQGYSGDGGAATNAELYWPQGVAMDAAGNVFISDWGNNRIRKVGINGIISTIAGDGTAGYSGDGGAATNAELDYATFLAVDATGNLLVSDWGNSRIREVGTNGIIATVAGDGTAGYSGDGGAAINAELWHPSGVRMDLTGNLWIGDAWNMRIRKVGINGIITTAAGDDDGNGIYGGGYSGDGSVATNAELYYPEGVAVDATGNLLIGDSSNNRIRKVVFSGPTLVLNDVGVGNAGAYDVVVSSPYGSVTSSVVNLAITTSLQVTTVSLPNGTNGFAYTEQLSAVNGQLPYSWSLLSGLLPSGLTLTTNGLISGTPTTDGTFNFTVKVTDALSETATQALTLTVPGLPNVVWIQPTNSSVAVALGSNVTFSVSVTGTGPFTYRWQLDGTNLPNGIGIIATVAGDGPTYPATGSYSGDGGAATNAGLSDPWSVTVDGTGNLFIADSGTFRVRKVGINGIITTVAGNGNYGYSGDGGPATNAELWEPFGVAVDRTGNVFVSDLLNQNIRKVRTNGIITTVAGNGTAGYSGDGGAATNAELNYPNGVAVDAIGNLFFADSSNQRIRKLGTNGIITTVAGNGTNGFSGDGGAATNARLDNPVAVAVDATGNLFISDDGNQRIRRVGTNGIITTVAGNGTNGYSGDGVAATNSELNYPWGVAVDTTGNLFIADDSNNRVREAGINGIITTLAGNGTSGYSGDGGSAAIAELHSPTGVAVDASGNLFIVDAFNSRIRKVVFNPSILGPTLVLTNVGTASAGSYDVVVSSPYGSVTSSVVNLTITTPLQVTTVSLPNGTNGVAYNQTLTASAVVPPFSWTNLSGALPPGLALATNGVISGVPTTNGTFNFTVKVTDALSETATQALALTVFGLPIVTIQPTNNPVVVAVGSNVTFAVSVTGSGPFTYQWQLNGTNLPNGIITTVAGNGTNGYSGDGGMATNAELSLPAGVAVDAAANLFIADEGNNRIRIVGTNGIIITVAGGGYNYPGDGGAATNAELWEPTGVAVDTIGNLFIADWYNNRIRKVGTNGIIITVAGNGYDAGTGSGGYSGDGGMATNAELDNPDGVAVDGIGNVFIVDRNNQRIRKVGTNGIITTVAGNGISGYSGDGGAATNAELYYPVNVAADASGNLFIADSYNYRVRKVGTNGIITTVAGGGYNYPGDGGAATNAGLSDPQGVAVDTIGNLFIADFGNERIRKVDAGGIITTVAGNGTNGYSGDGGVATNAEFNDPWGVVVNATGNLLIADWDNQRIRKVVFAGPTLVLTNLSAASAGAYDVVVSSPYGSVTSSVVNLTVTLSAPPLLLSPAGFNTKGGFQLSVYGQIGQAYTLQASTNLVNWVSILNFTCTNSPTYVVDPVAKNFRYRFYRLAQGTLLVPASPVVLGFGLAQPLTRNGLALMLQGPVGSNYVIQASTNLLTWLPITNFVSTNSPFYFNDPTATNYGRRFYRAVIP